LVSDLNALINSRVRKALAAVEARGGLAGKVGEKAYENKDSSGAKGGIASPLKEKTKSEKDKTVPDREYWPGGLTSSDGLFIFPAIKTLNMTDANSAAVQFQYADPNGTIATEEPS
jgi:hypothetical protein